MRLQCRPNSPVQLAPVAMLRFDFWRGVKHAAALACSNCNTPCAHLLVPSGSRRTRVDNTPACSPKKSRRADSSTSGLNRGVGMRACVSSKFEAWLPHSHSPGWSLSVDVHGTLQASRRMRPSRRQAHQRIQAAANMCRAQRRELSKGSRQRPREQGVC